MLKGSDVVDNFESDSPTLPASARTVKELNKNIQNVNVHVGDDGKLHFVDSAGADTVLPFSGENGFCGVVESANNLFVIPTPSKAKAVKKDSKSKSKNNSQKSKSKDGKLNLVKKIKLPSPKISVSKPNKNAKKLESEKTASDDTKIIDNVKVDSDGVPLLNQFDTEKIKQSNFLPKITINKISFSKIIMIVIGIIISIIGILQAMNDVVKVSDHVMYGEHESIAFGLIFLGIIIIILAFYKELMKIVGLNNLTAMDDIESSSNNKSSKKKQSKKK
jgi:hypothetical protein